MGAWLAGALGGGVLVYVGGQWMGDVGKKSVRVRKGTSETRGNRVRELRMKVGKLLYVWDRFQHRRRRNGNKKRSSGDPQMDMRFQAAAGCVMLSAVVFRFLLTEISLFLL